MNVRVTKGATASASGCFRATGKMASQAGPFIAALIGDVEYCSHHLVEILCLFWGGEDLELVLSRSLLGLNAALNSRCFLH